MIFYRCLDIPRVSQMKNLARSNHVLLLINWKILTQEITTCLLHFPMAVGKVLALGLSIML
jgi:hypothetical protein